MKQYLSLILLFLSIISGVEAEARVSLASQCRRGINPVIKADFNSVEMKAGESKKITFLLVNPNRKRKCNVSNFSLSFAGLPEGLNIEFPESIVVQPRREVELVVDLHAEIDVAGEFEIALLMNSDEYRLSARQNFILTILAAEQSFELLSVGSENITQSSADIRWRLNEVATGKVEYGMTTALGSFTNEDVSFNYSEHVQSIGNLLPGTIYYYRVHSRASGGASVISDTLSFSTQSADPICIKAAPTLAVTPVSFSGYYGTVFNYNITVTNNNQYCPSSVYQITQSGLPAGFVATPVSGELTLADGASASMSISMEASAGGHFTPSVNVVDSLNSNFSAEAEIVFDITPQEQEFSLLSAAAEDITENSANIRFILSENATGKIEYGTTTALGSFTNEETSFNYAEHVQSLSGLQADTTYYYKIHSTSQSGIPLISNVFNFSTLATTTPTCLKANPTLSLSQSSFSGDAGDSFNFNVTLKDNNQYCADQVYNLSFQSLFTGLSSNLVSSRTLASGASTTFAVTMNSASSMESGTYTPVLRVVDADDAVYATSANLTFALTGDSTPPPSGDLVYPPSQPHTATLSPGYAYPSGALPGYLDIFADPIHNFPVRRISDHVAFGLDPNSQRLKNTYSKNQTFNSDGSLVKLSGYPANILDAHTYEMVTVASIPSSAVWSNLDPDKMFGTSSDRDVVSFSVATNQRTVLRDFGATYSDIDFGRGEGNISNDDRYMPLVGVRRDNGTADLIVYDLINDQITGVKNIGNGRGDLDWFGISQLGGYAVALYSEDGFGTHQGLKSYNIDMTNERNVTDDRGHADLCIDQDGNEVFVGRGGSITRDLPGAPSVHMTRLDGGGTIGLFPEINGQGIWGLHISCRNTKRPGWAYISEAFYGGNLPASNEIFAVKLDSSNIVQRYVKHNSNVSAGYRHEVHPVPNQDGTKIVFTSNWGNSTIESYDTARAWVVEVPQTQD